MEDRMSQTEMILALAAKKCEACRPGMPPVAPEKISEMLRSLPGWENAAGKEIAKTWNFKNYYETIAFVNAIAWIAHREDHHPDLEVGYNKCRVRYSTHAVGGLSENDFICAAKVERLLEQ
jgi:4a-hydroxytetrahydrobiopterin dehydratase